MLPTFFHNTEGSRLTERVPWLGPCHVHSFFWGPKSVLVPSLGELSPACLHIDSMCVRSPTNRADVLILIHRSWRSFPPLDVQSHASIIRTPSTVAFRLRQFLSCCYCMTCGCLIPIRTTMTFFMEADSSQFALPFWDILALHRVVS